MIKSALFSGLSLLALAATPAFAEDGKTDHGDHVSQSPDIIVTAIYARDRGDILSGTSVVSGDDLVRELRPTIGETLIRQAGVSATSFGPNASRPVLRGFQGERVRVLSDGIGSFDVSNTSVDHPVAINPLTADRIEVLRGPAALLFGSSAIGGVVNVIDSRIPRRITDEKIHFDGNATYGSAANERSGGGRIDLPVSSKVILHFDGSYLKTGNLDIGGFVLAPALRAAAIASGDPDVAALADLKGKLPNSAARTYDVAGGAAIIMNNGNLGFSVSRYDSLIGLPVRFSLDPGVEAEAVRLDAKQTRFDLRGEVNPASGPIEAIKFRGGYAKYKHNELEEDGAVGTTFRNDGFEGRLELVQRKRGGWQGAIGGQFFIRDLRIVGEEKFLPPSDAQQFGLFTLQSFDLGTVRAEAGARVEHSILSAREDVDLGTDEARRTFTAVSGSLGASVEVVSGWRVGLNASYTERAPSQEELFSNGPHAGTQAFEIGNPDFKKEKSTGAELTLRGKGTGYSVSASVYGNDFDGFIIENPTGDIEDDLPVFVFTQSDVRYYGAEVEATVKLAQVRDFAINLDGVVDYTRAKVKNGGGSVARIPAFRVLGALEAASPRLNGRVEVERVNKQNRIAAFETPTKGYTMVNASLGFKPLGEDGAVSLTLSANNIFDVTARRAASFLKDFAPLAGRDIRVSARLSF
jgi:iron complex outermembrane recepter protein